jgi:colanic acid biosynthesis glycosyl transferase WcaI
VKILILGINYAPELTGIGKYSGEVAAWLAKQGFKVRVVTAPPYYPDWKVANGYSAVGYRRDRIESVDVWRCPLYVPARPSGLKRILHLASFAITSLPAMLRQILWKPDVVLVIEPPLFCAPTAWLVARLAGGKCWLHVQDFEVDAAFALGILPFAWLRRLVSIIESWLMRRFDAVSSISASMMQRLCEKGVETEKQVLFPNWSDLEKIRRDEGGAQAFRQQHGIVEDAFVALYAGNMGEKQGLELVIEAARKLADHQKIIFVLCGEGAAKARLQALSSGLGNVQFLPLQPLEELAVMLSAADLHLVIQRAGAADLVMPSKLTNILAVGGYSLITAGEDSELGRLVREHPFIGRLCPPEDALSLAEAIRTQAEAGEDSFRPEIRAFAESTLSKDAILSEFERQLTRL